MVPIAMAPIAMVTLVMANLVMANLVMANLVMATLVMVTIVMASIVAVTIVTVTMVQHLHSAHGGSPNTLTVHKVLEKGGLGLKPICGVCKYARVRTNSTFPCSKTSYRQTHCNG